jgi:hypothetical protein
MAGEVEDGLSCAVPDGLDVPSLVLWPNTVTAGNSILRTRASIVFVFIAKDAINVSQSDQIQVSIGTSRLKSR